MREYKKDSAIVRAALNIARIKGYNSKEVDKFVPDSGNLREVVKLCLEELEKQ